MTATFTLVVLDETHLVLTTEERMRAGQQRAIMEAFARWKAEGGVLVIDQCLVRDRQAVQVELEVEPEEDVVDAFVRSHGGK